MNVRAESTHGGRRARVVIDGGKGNILTIALLDEFTNIIKRLAASPDLYCITIEGEGDHFSYGASIEEHERPKIVALLSAMARASKAVFFCNIPTIAIVRGQCLGGGLELAAACVRIVASKEAKFGQPEINLGVFAPIGSLLLPFRIAGAAADELLISARAIHCKEALAIGLVDEEAQDPESAAASFVERELLQKSASSLRFAVAAARFDRRRRFETGIAALETMYTKELMSTLDANEGPRAFLEKRAPRWRNR